MHDVNVIILDPYEEFITWLDSEKVEITETNKIGEQRSIQITYPIDNLDEVLLSNWFDAGNKIYVPEGLGIDNCLYVINSEYQLDYWDKNEITIEAEEVLVELNNAIFEYIDSADLKINKDNLTKWFGGWYDIDTVDSIPSSKNTILPTGTMTLLTFLRDIEETTELIFKTEYGAENNKITRKLSLIDPDTAGTDRQTDFLDLNYNIENLEVTLDETSTYRAMFPLFSLNENTTTDTTTTTTSNVTSNTGTTATTRTDLKKVIDTWKALKVDYREKIPMIVEKQSDGSVKYTAYWYAPFTKAENSMYIENPVTTSAKYLYAVPYKSQDTIQKIQPIPKMGTVNTSETNPYAIYNALANSLLDKKNPKYTIKISLKDIQAILGDNNLGYSIYDHLYIHIPGFCYYVQATVTETKKNPHLAGENTITLETDANSTSVITETTINAENQILSSGEKATIGGMLVDDDGGVNGELITMTINLTKTYTPDDLGTRKNHTGTNGTIQTILNFHPQSENEKYYDFSVSEVRNMANIIRNYIITHHQNPKSVNMRAVTGEIYAVSFIWCRAIYYTFNTVYCLTDAKSSETTKLGTGKWYPVCVQWVSDKKKHSTLLYDEKTNGTHVESYPQYFYNRIIDTKTTIKEKYGITIKNDPVGTTDLQTGGDCVACAFSHASEQIWDFKTEKQCHDALHTDFDKGTDGETYIPIAAKKFKYSVYKWVLTWENLKTSLKEGYAPIVLVNLKYFPYYTNYYQKQDAYHGVNIVLAFSVNGKGYVCVRDSNFDMFTPSYGEEDVSFLATIITFSQLKQAIKEGMSSNGKSIWYVGNGIWWNNGTKKYTKTAPSRKILRVLKLTDKNKATVTEHGKGITTTFVPDTTKYTFSTNTIISTIQKQIYTKTNKILSYNVLFSKIVTVTDTKNKKWTMTADWLYAMYMDVVYGYKYKPLEKKANYTITVNKTSNTAWYRNKTNTDYNWFGYIAPTTEMVTKYGWTKIAISTILSMLWQFQTPADISTTVKETPTISEFRDYFSSYSNLYVFTVDLTTDTIKKYILNNIHTVGVSVHVEENWMGNYIQPDGGRAYQIITGLATNNKIEVYNVCGRGNYSKENNTVTASNSPVTNPWRYFSSVNTLQQNMESTDTWKGKMLVISIYTKTEIEKGLE